MHAWVDRQPSLPVSAFAEEVRAVLAAVRVERLALATPQERRLARRIEGALAAFDASAPIASAPRAAPPLPPRWRWQ